MVQVIDDERDVFAHIASGVVRLLQKLRRLVDKVCRKHCVKQTILIGTVKFFKTAGEQSERCADKDPACVALLQLACDVNHAVSGGDHIVDDDNVFAT